MKTRNVKIVSFCASRVLVLMIQVKLESNSFNSNQFTWKKHSDICLSLYINIQKIYSTTQGRTCKTLKFHMRGKERNPNSPEQRAFLPYPTQNAELFHSTYMVMRMISLILGCLKIAMNICSSLIGYW